MPSPVPFADLTMVARKLRQQTEKSRFILIYAYNGTGKTRLCNEFKAQGQVKDEQGDSTSRDTLYYSAYTEDLFAWDNDLQSDQTRVLRLNRDSKFFQGLEELEMDVKVGQMLERYSDFNFTIDYEAWQVIFFRDRDAENAPIPIKISRGEENIFIWCFFLAVLQLALDGAEAYEWVKQVYIDDPVSSLDEHNVVVVANHLVQILRESSSQIPVVVSTHHHLFFNVIHYELKNHFRSKSVQYVLGRDRETAGFKLTQFSGDTPSFHHIAALQELTRIAQSNEIHTYHFNQLRTILEKTALFHGYTHFGKCIKESETDADGILHQRFVDLMSHGKYSMFEPVEMGEETKAYFRTILASFLDKFPFNPEHFPREESQKTTS